MVCGARFGGRLCGGVLGCPMQARLFHAGLCGRFARPMEASHFSRQFARALFALHFHNAFLWCFSWRLFAHLFCAPSPCSRRCFRALAVPAPAPHLPAPFRLPLFFHAPYARPFRCGPSFAPLFSHAALSRRIFVDLLGAPLRAPPVRALCSASLSTHSFSAPHFPPHSFAPDCRGPAPASQGHDIVTRSQDDGVGIGQ